MTNKEEKILENLLNGNLDDLGNIDENGTLVIEEKEIEDNEEREDNIFFNFDEENEDYDENLELLEEIDTYIMLKNFELEEIEEKLMKIKNEEEEIKEEIKKSEESISNSERIKERISKKDKLDNYDFNDIQNAISNIFEMGEKIEEMKNRERMGEEQKEILLKENEKISSIIDELLVNRKEFERG